MNRDHKTDQKPSAQGGSHMRAWLSVIVILLLFTAAALFLLPHFINTASIKQKIQAAITERIGGQVDFQAIDLSYFPRPAIELRQVALNIPDKVEGTIAALRLAPALYPLLNGDLRLARLELDSPQLNLKLPEKKAAKTPAQPYTFTTMEKQLNSALGSFVEETSHLKLQIDDARLTIAQGTKKQIEIEDLTLQFTISVTDPHSARGHLQSTFSKLSLYRKGLQEMVKDTSIDCSLQMERDRLTVALDQLAITEPNLELAGDLVLAKSSPAITLNLSSSNINVDSTRRTALALAGDTPPTRDIFDYLRGGKVPHISFTSRGENFSELTDLDNMVIKGQLQKGKVSIPPIKLDLTEVNGNVIISKGVLQGTGLSTRLEGSTGRDGSLLVGLAKDNDLFQLELTLSANLTETATILHRVVADPVFIAELEKIKNVQGTSNARLTLGDSLNDINAKVEASDIKFSADYQRVPLPIDITQGQFTFSKEHIAFNNLVGTLGKSHFTDFSCLVTNTKAISLDISSGPLELVTAELYPWITSLKGLRHQLKDIKRVQGQLDVSALKFVGTIDNPLEGKYTATGKVQDLSIETTLFPSTISFTRGGITVVPRQLSFTRLHTATQDAVVNLTGNIKGFPQQLSRIELALDGQMGPRSVKWLADKLELPEAYAVRTPLSISGAQISWQPESTASFKGTVAVDKGPKIVADVGYQQKLLQVRQLAITDQYSDASLVFDIKNNQNDFRFSGKLQEETLKNLFIKNPVSGGQLEGNLSVVVPRNRTTRIVAEGQLTGEDVPIPLPSGNDVDIDQITLRADGSDIRADLTRLSWQGLTWEPIQATVSLSHDRADIRLAEAKLCGINSPGFFSIAKDNFSLNTTLAGKGLDVDTSYTCLTKGHVQMTGSLDISSQITAQGEINQLLKNLEGPLKMTFRNGVIKKDKVLARILELLNVTEIVKGRLPNLATQGFGYNSIRLKGKFHKGKLIIDKLYMDGETLDVVGKGKIHLEERTVDFQLVASPFKTANSIIKHIPGLNYLMNDNLVSIPLSITGPMAEPKVKVLSITSVGTSLLNMAERTIKAPVKLLEAINPWSEDK